MVISTDDNQMCVPKQPSEKESSEAARKEIPKKKVGERESEADKQRRAQQAVAMMIRMVYAGPKWNEIRKEANH